MKSSLLAFVTLPLLALSQTTDFSPPFNPDPDYTGDLPPTTPIATTFPSITIPASEDFTISITWFDPTPTEFTLSDNDPILTGTPDPRPSYSVSTTVVSGGENGTTLTTTPSVTGTGSLTTSRTTIVTTSGSVTQTSVSTSQFVAGAGTVGQGAEGVFAGLVLGVLGMFAWL